MAKPDRPFDPADTPQGDFIVPDLMEATEGWRSWKVHGELPPYGALPKLLSVVHKSHPWLPRQVFTATCRHCADDDVPGVNCRCGAYSAKAREHLLSMGYHVYDGERDGMFCVIGIVANWGNTVEGTQGWRSQFSYPVKLFVPYEAHRLAKPLANAYGIPVVLDNFLKPVMKARVL